MRRLLPLTILMGRLLLIERKSKMNKTDKRKLDAFYCYLVDIAHTDTPIANIAFAFNCEFLGFHKKKVTKHDHV